MRVNTIIAKDKNDIESFIRGQCLLKGFELQSREDGLMVVRAPKKEREALASEVRRRALLQGVFKR